MFTVVFLLISLSTAQDTRPVAIFTESIIGCLPITLTPAADGSCNLPVLVPELCINRARCDCNPDDPALEFEYWDHFDIDLCELDVGSISTGRLEADVVGPCVGLFVSCRETVAASWQTDDSFLIACPECAGVMANRTRSTKDNAEELMENLKKQEKN